MRYSLLLPLIFLSVAGCVNVDKRAPPQPAATVVTPAPATSSSTTVIKTP